MKKADKLRLKNNVVDSGRKKGEVLTANEDAIYSDESDDEQRAEWAARR